MRDEIKSCSGYCLLYLLLGRPIMQTKWQTFA